MNDLAKKKPKTIKGYKLEEIDGEVLLYSPKATQAIYLNPTASLIWQLCADELTIQEIIETLQQHFPESTDAIANDVKITIEQLVNSKAVELI